MGNIRAGVWTNRKGKDFPIDKMPHGYLVNAFDYVSRTARTLLDCVRDSRARVNEDPYIAMIVADHERRAIECLYWRAVFRRELRRRRKACR